MVLDECGASTRFIIRLGWEGLNMMLNVILVLAPCSLLAKIFVSNANMVLNQCGAGTRFIIRLRCKDLNMMPNVILVLAPC